MHPLAKLRAVAWLSRPSVPGKGAGRTTSLAGFFEGAGIANSDARRYSMDDLVDLSARIAQVEPMLVVGHPVT